MTSVDHPIGHATGTPSRLLALSSLAVLCVMRRIPRLPQDWKALSKRSSDSGGATVNIEEDSHSVDLSWARHRLRPTAHHRDDLVVTVVPGAGRHSSTRTIPGSARSVPSKNRATCSRVR